MIKITENCQKIILFLGNYQERKFFTKEISEKLRISLGGTHNALKYLAKEKIVKTEQRGNIKFYQINDENPLVKQLKTTMVIEQLIPLVNRIKNDSEKIILFGSASRGEQTADSDIDLFVLTHNPEIIKKNIAKLKRKLPINSVIKTPNQWGELEIKEPEFYNEVKQGIKLFNYD
ncbi:MAG: nucleotidyltransferase domain-containing protein [Minisyncoccales bacterium]